MLSKVSQTQSMIKNYINSSQPELNALKNLTCKNRMPFRKEKKQIKMDTQKRQKSTFNWLTPLIIYGKNTLLIDMSSRPIGEIYPLKSNLKAVRSWHDADFVLTRFKSITQWVCKKNKKITLNGVRYVWSVNVLTDFIVNNFYNNQYEQIRPMTFFWCLLIVLDNNCWYFG